MLDLRNFRSEWKDGDLTGWSCAECNWKLYFGPRELDIAAIGSALSEYLRHECSGERQIVVPPELGDVVLAA